MNGGRTVAVSLAGVAFTVAALWYTLGRQDSPPSDVNVAPAIPAGERSRRPASPHATRTATDVAAPTPQGPAAGLPATAAPAAPGERPSSEPAKPGAPALTVDASGNFYPDAKTVEVFESFLSSELPIEQSAAAARAEIAKQLEPPAEGQALEFLDRYLDYRRRGIELGLNQDVTEDFTPRFAQLRSLRREFFGIDAGQRMFGDEEKAANIALREHEILSDPDLSEEERNRRLDELHNPPPESRE